MVRCIDHVTLRDMILKLPCDGPCMAMLLMHACLCLERCVVSGVHDRKPVLTEGGAVCPSEVSHKLENEKHNMISGEQSRRSANISLNINMVFKMILRVRSQSILHQLSLLSYLDAVLHVLFAGLLLHHL